MLHWLYKWYRYYRLLAYQVRPTCPACGEGKLYHLGTDIHGDLNVYNEIYICDNCGKHYF